MLENYPGLRLQHSREQRPHKISYLVDPARFEGPTRLIRDLRKADIHVNVTYSFKAFLDITPINASKGLALRYFAIKWGLPVEQLLVVGDSGNDEEMLRGSTLGAVVGNHTGDLLSLQGKPEIYFAAGHYAQGILEAIDHYHFLDPELPDSDTCPL
jgi:sucrose-phosphate synthase